MLSSGIDGQFEAPVTLPEPDELETDFNGLKQWQTEFKNRPITPVMQEAK
jgi:hypothetical protein